MSRRGPRLAGPAVAATPARPSVTDRNLRDDAKRAALTPPTGGKMDGEKR